MEIKSGIFLKGSLELKMLKILIVRWLLGIKKRLGKIWEDLEVFIYVRIGIYLVVRVYMDWIFIVYDLGFLIEEYVESSSVLGWKGLLVRFF